MLRSQFRPIPFSSPLVDPAQSPAGSPSPSSFFPFRSCVLPTCDLSPHTVIFMDYRFGIALEYRLYFAVEYRLLVRLSQHLPFSLSPRAAILVMCSPDERPSLLEGSRWLSPRKKVRRSVHHFALEYPVVRPSHDRPVSSRFRGLRSSISAHFDFTQMLSSPFY